MKVFSRIVFEPSRFYRGGLSKINVKPVIRHLSKNRGNPDVAMVAELESAVRLSSTCLDLVSRL